MTERRTVLMHEDEPTIRIRLPHGIGYVEIRTGNIQPTTGYPVVAVDVVSHAIDTPAEDGRFYEPRFKHTHNMIYMAGCPAEYVTVPVPQHTHDHQRAASWPTGPDGETASLLVCACGDQVTTPEEPV